MRVFPDGERLDHAGLAGGVPVELQEGAAVAAGGSRASGDSGHAGEGADAGAAGESEQYGLGLVVTGVAEQDRGGAVALGGGVQSGVPRVPGGGLGPSLPAYGDTDGLDGVKAEFGESYDDFGCAQIGAGLQTVVNGDATGADAELAGFEGEGGGERHGVGAAGACHEHERRGRLLVRGVGALSVGVGGRVVGEDVVEDLVEDAADRQAYRRDRWMGTHVRFPS